MFGIKKIKSDIEEIKRNHYEIMRAEIGEEKESLKKKYDLEAQNLKEQYRIEFSEVMRQFKSDFEKHLKDYSNSIEDIKVYVRNENDLLKKQASVNTEERLVIFHKEISDRYFNTLENIFKFNKEIALLDKLASQVSDKDFDGLKAQLMQPLLESRWKEKEISEGQKIVNKGQLILRQKIDLQETIIQEEKQGKDVTKLREQLKAYNKILEAIK